MPVTVVVGGQFGSEGKGKVAHYLTDELGATVAIRVGGTNSGHTVIDALGRAHILRVLPTASVSPDVLCVVGAGSYIDVDVFLGEVARFRLPPARIAIDPNAFIITEEDRHREATRGLRAAIGSTLSGTGAAVVRRVSRQTASGHASDDPRLAPYLRNVRELLRQRLRLGERIVVEGTQGFGLSLLHADHYPYVTSRDTTAAAFVSEAGLSPLDVDDVTLVLRAFPIRVSGNSGPLPNEIDWPTVAKEAGSPDPISERTSVTNRVRRVARFRPEVVLKAIDVNAPTRIVMNHVDYVDARCRISGRLSEKAATFLTDVEESIGCPIDLLGFGPAHLRRHKEYRQSLRVV